MIGSHNTLSYLPPKNLWGKITRPWNKCQDKTLAEQINAGIDYLDIRINLYINSNNEYEWHFVHNRVDYGVVNENVWKAIGNTKLPIRVIYDKRLKPFMADRKTSVFLSYVNMVERTYNVNVDSAITYWDWKEHYKPSIEVKEFHASVSAKWYQYLLGCKWFALTYSGISKYPDVEECMNEVLLLDYV